MEWIKNDGTNLPINEEVLAYHPEWVTNDINSKGVRVGYLDDADGLFYSAAWDNYQDWYAIDKMHMPTHFMELKAPQG